MLRYLALGDSYTIGEQISKDASLGFQTASLLRNKYQLPVEDPQVIAKTGWTTDELKAAVKEANLPHDFDLVSLLIGVNNQYRGLPIESYRQDFAQLVIKSILLARSHASHVFIVSIPDWSVTPFASREGRPLADTSNEIAAYNKINKNIALAYRCHYLDITPGSQEHGKEEAFLTDDQLHYNEKEYAIWATRLAALMAGQFKE